MPLDPAMVANLPAPVPSIQDIMDLQRAILLDPPNTVYTAETGPQPQHFFWPGKYGRMLTLEADSGTVGKIHRHDHPLLVLSGFAEVVDGTARYLLRGGDAMLSRAGVKRAVLCIERTTFLTIHDNPTDTRDLAAIEAEHIVPEEPEVQALIASINQGTHHDLGSNRSGGSVRGLHLHQRPECPPGPATPAAEPASGGG